ncbi:hypothetical protein ACJJTC_017021 [Scirpophaga incertulas]
MSAHDREPQSESAALSSSNPLRSADSRSEDGLSAQCPLSFYHQNKRSIYTKGLQVHLRTRHKMTEDSVCGVSDTEAASISSSHETLQSQRSHENTSEPAKKHTIHHQLCYAHGRQLAVLDVLYQKNTLEPTEVTERVCEERTISQEPQIMENIEEVDENDDVNIDNLSDFFVTAEVPEVQLMPTYRAVIQKVRKIVNCFKSSPKKNDLLQTYTKAEILDCKTSLASMIARFK